VLDGFELRAGTDPLRPDAELDGDLDGEVNRDEMRAGTNPRVAEPRISLSKMRYDVQEIGSLLVTDEESYLTTERRCYDFTIRNIPLSVTTSEDRRDRGVNRIFFTSFSQTLSSAEAPSKVRRACVEAVLSSPESKEPGDLIDLTTEGWQLMRDQLYLGVDDISACVGVEFVQRDRVLELMTQCLPEAIDLNGYRYPQETLVDRMFELFDRRMYLTIPQDPVNLFIPLAQFNPDEDCYRPKHSIEMVELLNSIAESCLTCEAVQAALGSESDAGSESEAAEADDQSGSEGSAEGDEQ
jgi:hypothetical protein